MGDEADAPGVEATVTPSLLIAIMSWSAGESKRPGAARWRAARLMRDVLDEATDACAGEVHLPACGPRGAPLVLQWGRMPDGPADGVPVLAAPPGGARWGVDRPPRPRRPGGADAARWFQGLGDCALDVTALWETFSAGPGHGVLESPASRCHASELLVFLLLLPPGAWKGAPGGVRRMGFVQMLCAAMLGPLAALGDTALVPGALPAPAGLLCGPSGRKRRRLDPSARAALLAPAAPIRGARPVVEHRRAIEESVRYLRQVRSSFGACRVLHVPGRSESERNRASPPLAAQGPTGPARQVLVDASKMGPDPHALLCFCFAPRIGIGFHPPQQVPARAPTHPCRRRPAHPAWRACGA